MTAASMNVNVVRGVVSTWPGRILVIVLTAVLVGGAILIFRGNTGTAAVTYRTAEATKASLAQTVAISGSVNPSGQARLNFRSSGRLSAILVTVGQQVTAGQELARIEATDLDNTLANAQNSLASALSNLQRQNQSYADAQRSLDNARKSATTDVANAQAALAKMKSNFASAKSNYQGLTVRRDRRCIGLPGQPRRVPVPDRRADRADEHDRRRRRHGRSSQCAQLDQSAKSPALQNAQANSLSLLTPALAEYQSARSALLSLIADFESAIAASSDTTGIAASYQTAQTNYAIALSRLTSALDTTSSVLTTIQTSVTSAQASLNTQSTRSLHDPFDQWRAALATMYTLVGSEQQRVSTLKLKLSQATTSANTLSDAINGSYVTAIQNVPAVIDRTAQTVQSAETSLASKPADIQSAQNTVASAQLSVATAQANLENATLRAPSAGVDPGDQRHRRRTRVFEHDDARRVLANTGTVQLHGTVGESEVSKLKLGLVANVSVEALGATTRMTGKVTGIDPVATIQQGVPVYGVDITIDVANAAIKPGMSGTANVILVSRQDVLTVPNLAVKTQGARRYVQVLRDGQPVDVDATFGISNDTLTEVTGGGLKEGDLVILPQPRAGATVAPNRGGQQLPGGAGGGGIVIR